MSVGRVHEIREIHRLDFLSIPIYAQLMVFTAADARKLIRRMIEHGKFSPPGPKTHARKEMDKESLQDRDALNVLRGGVVREGEWENGDWRYHVETARMVFVVTFDPEPDWMPSDEEFAKIDLVIVTGWRIRT